MKTTIISQNSRNMELFAIFFATLQPLKSQQSRLLSSAHLLVIDDLTNSLISLMSAKTAEGKKKSGKIPYKIFTSSFQEITSNSKVNTTSDIEVKIYGIPLFAKF